MEKLFESISSYNLLNFLLPGATFAFLSPHTIGLKIYPDEIVGQLTIAYFIGLILSRAGSLLLEWPLKKIGVLKPSNYKDYVIASQKDHVIGVLLETCNMYRTFSAGAILSLVAALLYVGIQITSMKALIMGSVCLLLVASFVKQ